MVQTKPIAGPEIETGPVNDTFRIDLCGPRELQEYALTRLREAMADLPGVVVELNENGRPN